ncbi:hypothetical protein BABINDRAFT_163825 [Babjeviella inositovora NRRL Y-12698]|uniref:Cyclin N-terminal domain-containing protein n=1 Tax=Babjeviella inositovora NRRL Y-12698 TaxID=984486 RepID=A0A1E3QHC5_9ASCO|nr:uncharacterized protein BABINDRAFT_163825 [Babjeviella inositovora NRRL Y-12698]ODQ77091.1 hypothetical protein BABINDRAFT_163825 [Babjeviella inositovora NRRL Y-12698]
MSDSKALKVFIQQPVNKQMIEALVVATLTVLPCQGEFQKSAYPSPPASPSGQRNLPSLHTFITKLVKETHVYTGTLMATLVYLGRLRTLLPANAEGLPCTRHRIFLACLVLSAKFHNDSSPKNKHWAKYTGLFEVSDINLMERQLLYLLNWDLRVQDNELYFHLKEFLDPIRQDMSQAKRLKKSVYKPQKQVQKLEQPASHLLPPVVIQPALQKHAFSPSMAITPVVCCMETYPLSSQAYYALDFTPQGVSHHYATISSASQCLGSEFSCASLRSSISSVSSIEEEEAFMASQLYAYQPQHGDLHAGQVYSKPGYCQDPQYYQYQPQYYNTSLPTMLNATPIHSGYF